MNKAPMRERAWPGARRHLPTGDSPMSCLGDPGVPAHSHQPRENMRKMLI